MGAATKVSEVFSFEEDAPTSAEDAVYTAETKVGEGAYVAITKLMNLDHVEANRKTVHDDVPPVQYKSGFVPRVTPPAVDKNRETMPAPALADEEELEPTNIVAAPWIPPQVPTAAIPEVAMELPSTDLTPEVPVVFDAHQVPEAAISAPVTTPVAPFVAESRAAEVAVFAIAFFTTLLPVVIYLLAR